MAERRAAARRWGWEGTEAGCSQGKANGADNPFETRLKRLLCCPLDRRNGIKPEMSGRRPGGRTAAWIHLFLLPYLLSRSSFATATPFLTGPAEPGQACKPSRERQSRRDHGFSGKKKEEQWNAMEATYAGDSCLPAWFCRFTSGLHLFVK
ncbi:hypothetical protein HPP92_004239 [Vanilla planifolia]|uniref:Uncharacterized protein n=1 Tax=Vanilla planifolia TaxID=51239 RepID=A0A835S922_VANPL|nr:hypothetical protein HPP92_004239 [Vanilla planifolia]